MIPVLDAHADTLSRLEIEKRSFLVRSEHGHLDLPRLHDGGVQWQVLALCARCEGLTGPSATDWVISKLDQFSRIRQEGNLRLIQKASELGQTGFLILLEGGDPLAGDLAKLDFFFQQGVRLIGLTWNGRNELVDGIGADPNPHGLTPFGIQVVERMNELGMVIDLAHVAEPGFWDTLDRSSQPVVVTHANAYQLCPHPRNLRDDQIKAIAEQGGVVGVTFVPTFLKQDGKAGLEDVVRHVDHIVSLIGPAHVAFGSDYDGIKAGPKGLEHAGHYQDLLNALLKRGYSHEDVRSMASGNWLRVFGEVLPKS